MHKKVRKRLPRRGYTVDRAGLMSAAKSTLSDDVHHRMLPPWGLYFLKCPTPFPHHPHFCDRVNHDDATPSRGIVPQIASAHARKGVGEVTPKGLYGRQGRVDERSEIYPV